LTPRRVFRGLGSGPPSTSKMKHVFEMHDLSLGGKSKVMEITYTRKKA
jgi:hypothetical protein